MKFEKVSYKEFKNNCMDMHLGYGEIKLPRAATKRSAGYDIYSTMEFDLKPGQTVLIPTGIKVELDDDKCFVIMPRSGQGFKYKVQLYNTVGLIDADYYNNKNNEGHIFVKLYNDSPNGDTLHINVGDAICQGVILQYFTVDEDDRNTLADREGGFGSTS